ncbi:CTD kinase subunit alpha [Penicillium capsulatum]|nr:CTD kinase subunit alpha [Penicillium capsulatum]
MGEPPHAPPAGRESEASTPADKGAKFSFALKPKTTPAPAPKPVPDFSQRMQPREPPPRVPDPPTPRNRLTNGPMPTFKPEPRFDRRDRNRGRDLDFDRDRRDFRDSRNYREPQDRRDDRRFDNRRDRRRGDRRSDFRPEHRREPPSPELQKQPSPKPKQLAFRYKPRPMLSEEFAKADSVYYRKPGNESVIGAGTYGKVFKGVHVYTKRQVALKKIRMEGEKDGFPFTATREIKLLQYLRHRNVVSLLEVMVERNECFMVFEYLSHDLTGLINHPNFTLSLAHKKDLARQMFEGLNYLHHRGVLHRDIKAANILISNQGLLKYADFGLARFYKKHRQDEYTNRVITICAACVCMEMFTKKAVFPGEGGEISQLEKLFNSLGTPTRADWADFVEMPWFQLMRPAERKKRIFEDTYREILSPEALNLISSIFQYDPTRRPSAEEVLKHAYFASEEPKAQQALELEEMKGDWHEFESKALRKEARRAEQQSQKDRDKRKAETATTNSARDPKRARPDPQHGRTAAA